MQIPQPALSPLKHSWWWDTATIIATVEATKWVWQTETGCLILYWSVSSRNSLTTWISPQFSQSKQNTLALALARSKLSMMPSSIREISPYICLCSLPLSTHTSLRNLEPCWFGPQYSLTPTHLLSKSLLDTLTLVILLLILSLSFSYIIYLSADPVGFTFKICPESDNFSPSPQLPSWFKPTLSLLNYWNNFLAGIPVSILDSV